VAGTRIAEIGATLLTFKCVPQRPVWSEQFRNSNVACGSSKAIGMEQDANFYTPFVHCNEHTGELKS